MYHKTKNRTKWTYSNDPFPAFRCDLVFGRNKRDRGMIPCKATVEEDGLLIDHRFMVVKTKAKGTLMLVPGEDVTDRVLWFGGVDDGFRGFSKVVTDHTTATILKTVSARSACDGRTEVAAIMRPSEQVVFHRSGRSCNEYFVVAAGGGGVVVEKTYSAEEWRFLTEDGGEGEAL